MFSGLPIMFAHATSINNANIPLSKIPHGDDMSLSYCPW